jgi:hypothetical protein
MPEIAGELKALEYALRNSPNPNLIMWAGIIVDGTPRELLPDWVEALANGNMALWESVCAVALAELDAQEAEDAAQ